MLELTLKRLPSTIEEREAPLRYKVFFVEDPALWQPGYDEKTRIKCAYETCPRLDEVYI